MRRAAAIGLLAAFTGMGCLQILGDEYELPELPCADVVGCQECFQCANEDVCADESAACTQTPCLDYADCSIACSGTASCDDDCEAQFPGGRGLWDLLFACGESLCEEACGL